MKRVLVIIFLAAAVAASAIVYWRHATNAAQAGEAPELLLYAPADAKAVAYLDLAALRSSAFITELAALAPSQAPEREYLDFVQATGFDYTRDLDRAALVIRPQGNAQLVLAVAEGRFDHTKIAAYALRSGTVDRTGGQEIYEIPQLTPGNSGALAFLASNRIALTQGPGARAALEALIQHGPQPALDPALRARVMRVAGSPVFGVGRMDQVPQILAPGGLRSDQLENLAREVRWVALGLRPDGEILDVAAEGECDTPEGAHQLGGTLDGLRLLGQAMLSDPKTRGRLTPQAAVLFDTLLKDIRVSQDGARVRLTLELTHAEIRQMLSPAAPSPNGR